MTLRTGNILPFLVSPFLKLFDVINVAYIYQDFYSSWVEYGNNGERMKKAKNQNKA